MSSFWNWKKFVSGIISPAEEAGVRDGEGDATSASGTIGKHRGRSLANFSESELADSGVSRSLLQDLPGIGPLDDPASDPSPGYPAYSEELLLSKIQDVQLELIEIRELKEALLAAANTTEASSTHLNNHIPQKLGLLVVSYRLPVSVSLSKSGKIKLSVTSGGLLSAFTALKTQMKVRWLGLPTIHVSKPDIREEAHRILSEEYSYIPVQLQPDDYEIHLLFCNSVLWPLYHYLPLSLDGGHFHPEMFQAYERVNEEFTENILAHYRENDALWIHDFQLMLVPQKLRARRPKAKIGFFLHTPFPSAEIYRTLPTRREMLEGILGADLIGFHTYDYARHFLSACARVLCLETRPNGVEYNGVFVRVGIFPIGIDTNSFLTTLRSPRMIRKRLQLKEALAGKKVIIGVDRVDYIKGIPHKLLALESFLKKHPEYIGKVVMIQIGVPSDSGQREYQLFRSVIHEMVGRINGELSTLDYVPIYYLEQHISYEELVALYSTADVALITSLRDGMNLISYEYTVCQQENRGVLIVSEFAGAAQSLPGALVCNPWDIDGITECIEQALAMPDHERRTNHKKIYRHIMIHTSALWGHNFVTDLLQIADQRQKAMEQMKPLEMSRVREQFKTCESRLIFLDYDGTLTKKRNLSQVARPSSRLLSAVNTLARDPRNLVFVLTERDIHSAASWVKSGQIGVAAEHGFQVLWPDSHKSLRPDSDWVTLGQATVEQVLDILPRVVLTLERYEDLLPGSSVTVKETSATWYFRDAEPEFAFAQAQSAQHELEHFLDKAAMEVVMGQKILYVQPRGVGKGATAQYVLEQLNEAERIPDMIISFGDDRADEHMFQTLDQMAGPNTTVVSCTVGRRTSKAKYFVDGFDDVVHALEALM